MVQSTGNSVDSSNELSLPSTSLETRKWWGMLAVGIGVFMFGLDVHIVNLALPTLVRELHTNFATVQGVALSYLLTLSSFMLGAARLGDMWNKKWLYLGGLIIFSFSSLLCGLAPSIGFLIGFRALQGLGAVFMAALGAAIITEIFPESERGRALGFVAGISTVGIALGPTVGGMLIGLGSWRLIFLVNVPFGIIASAIAILSIPSLVSSDRQQSFDLVGLLLITVSLTCFILGMTLEQEQSFNSSIGLILLAISVAFLAGFLLVESRLSEPMLDLQIFRSLNFSLSLLLSLTVYTVIVGITFILPFFLEFVKHYPIQEAGLFMAALPIVTAVVAPISGMLSDRFGERSISVIGLISLAIGCFAISTFDTQLTVLGYMMRIFPYGLGIGLFQSPNNSAVMGILPRNRLSIGSGLLSLSRTLGQTIGLSFMGVLFSFLTFRNAGIPDNIDITTAPAVSLVYGMRMSFQVVGFMLVAAVIMAVLLWWYEQRRKADRPDLGEQKIAIAPQPQPDLF